MSYEPPAPPTELPSDLVDSLDGSSPDELRRAASYAEELAEYRERDVRLDGEDDEDEVEEEPDDLPDETPDGVPSKATVTTKEINGNRYDYWQWRDGDQVKSKYKGPASPDE